MKPSRSTWARGRQTGQTVVWFLATIAACCCVLALVYNVGQVTNKKEATVNAADAAALSGALIEARMLNFEAYANRAMIANEVTVAQLVSAESFMNYSDTLLQNIATYTSIVPILDDITSTLSQVVDVETQVTDAAVTGGIAAVEGVNSVLQPVALAAFHSGAAAANNVSSNIAAANVTVFNGRDDQSPQLSANGVALALNEASWISFVNNGDDPATVKNLVVSSRDPFATQRNNSSLLDTLNTLMEIAGGGTEYTQLDKTSGTTVLDNFDHWEAQDSMDVDQNTCLFFGHVCSTDNLFIDMGYGRADADANGDNGKNLCNSTGFFGLPTWNCMEAMNNPHNLNWNGLPTLLDLASGLGNSDPCTRQNGSDSPSVPYVMAVQEAGAASLTTQNLGSGLNNVDVPGPQGSPRMDDQFQNGNLTAISEACVFFLRPDGNTVDPTRGALAREDGKHEFASLYNPYWQARLTQSDTRWITALYAAIGRPELVPFAITPPHP